MLKQRMRDKLVGQTVQWAEHELTPVYPFGEIKVDPQGVAIFHTGQPVPLSTVGKEDPMVIDLGMYVDENGLLQIYDTKMKL